MKTNVIFLLVCLIILFTGCPNKSSLNTNDSNGNTEPEKIAFLNNTGEISEENSKADKLETTNPGFSDSSNNVITNTTIYQNTDPLLSNYRKSPDDHYSWKAREITYDSETTFVSKEKLVSTMWVTDIFCWGKDVLFTGAKLVFYMDDKFKAGYDQGGVCVEGSYEIMDNSSVRLHIEKYYDYGSYFKYFGDQTSITLEIKKDNSNIFYTDYLYDNENSGFWYALGSNHKSGDKFSINDIPVIAVWEAFVTNQNVKIKEIPDETSNTILLSDLPSLYKMEKFKFNPKGTIFTTLARSENKVTINGITDYWYFSLTPSYHSQIIGWMFGEYIEKAYSDKLEIYKSWLTDSLEEIESNYPEIFLRLDFRF